MRSTSSNIFGKHIFKADRVLGGLVLLSLAIYIFTSSAQAQNYGGGNGTAKDPYQIRQAGDLFSLASNHDDWNKHFKLMADIEFSGSGNFKMIGQYLSGVSVKPFTGVFDGKGHVIKNCVTVANEHDYAGMFCYVSGSNTEIKNLVLVDCRAHSGWDNNNAGTLVGRMSSGIISNCRAEGGKVVGYYSGMGGLVGRNSGTIINCYSDVYVWNYYGGAGGLVGENFGNIINCNATGDIRGDYDVGGLVATNSRNVISCRASANVTGGNFIGGLVGVNEYAGNVSKSFTYGNVGPPATYESGGLVGRNLFGGEIYDCYSFADVSGVRIVGGLVGTNWDATIVNCYSAGNVSGTNWVSGLGNNADDGIITNSFWDIETSGRSTSGGGIGKTTSQMQTKETFISAGWDFTTPVWMIDDGEDYPRLWQEDIDTTKYGGGDGNEVDPYQIWTAEQLNEIGASPEDWDNHFILMADIDLSIYSDTQFNIIGPHYDGFSGVFDGNGHTISNMTYTSIDTDQAALFGVLDGANAEIRNLRLLNANIHAGSGWRTGLLVGYLKQGTVTNCSAEGGSVSGSWSVGGLVGWNDYFEEGRGGVISNCYASCEVTASSEYLSYAGGLVGCNCGFVSNCFSTSNVSGFTHVGGLAGHNFFKSGNSLNGKISDSYASGSVYGTESAGGFMGSTYYGEITNCYAVGKVNGSILVGGFVGEIMPDPNAVGIINHCFWDIESTGQLESAGGTGKQTTQMMQEITFTDEGWDFLGEIVNGTEDTWTIYEGWDYPRLAWERYSDGTGTTQNPYLIYKSCHMQAIGANPDDWDKNFKLTADIDLSAYTPAQFNIIGWYEDGLNNEPFTGVFDGNDHTISNFIHQSAEASCVGLIGYIAGQTAQIKDLVLLDPNIISTGGISIGALAGFIGEGSTVSDCHVKGGMVKGNEMVGGLVGRMAGATLARCSADCEVTGKNWGIGGLIGDACQTMVSECYSTGSVTAENLGVGGLIGHQYAGQILTSYATGPVRGTACGIGGLVGIAEYALLDNCYAAGAVYGVDEVGGFAGSCIHAEIIASFWDISTTGQPEGIGYDEQNGTVELYDKTTDQMRQLSTFADYGWDFAGESANGSDDVWTIWQEAYYPRLTWENPITGDFAIDRTWMYQNLPDATKSTLTTTVSVTDDPLNNNSYTYRWRFVLPDDVTTAPTITGGGCYDPFCTFAAPACNQPEGISDFGKPFHITLTVTGNDYGNTGIAQAEFGIVLLGDVNNDSVVNVVDRSIINAFWRMGSAGPFTFKECNLNCDGAINQIDRSIANAVWRGLLGQYSVTGPCPFR